MVGDEIYILDDVTIHRADWYRDKNGRIKLDLEMSVEGDMCNRKVTEVMDNLKSGKSKSRIKHVGEYEWGM